MSTQNIVKLMGKNFFTLKFCLSTLVLKCQPMTAVWSMCTYYDKYDNRDSLLSRTGMFDYELIIYWYFIGSHFATPVATNFINFIPLLFRSILPKFMIDFSINLDITW